MVIRSDESKGELADEKTINKMAADIFVSC
jgi:hypothetical protein